MTPYQTRNGEIAILGPMTPEYQSVLTAEALEFIAELVARYAPERGRLMARRRERQVAFDGGALPDFLPETAAIRAGDWTVAPIPADLQDRRVEITGPVDRKMIINALNAPVKCFMACLEDALSPTWDNVIQGQINLKDAVAGTISFSNPDGKTYRLSDKTAVLIARPRGWHLPEKHITLNGQIVPAALVDFGLYFFHNARDLIAKGTGPYYYLPKLESHLEARLWAQVMDFSEDQFGLARGTIKATILIETLPAVFEMDEILYEMRDHIVALNCGRWDYIFSYIKTLKNHSDRVLPDRGVVSMDKPFLDAYSRLLIKTCHKRGALAMGGMAAFIPVKDPGQNEIALAKVRADKEREARNGHDGTWIAHPGLAGVATEVFDKYIGPNRLNQLHVLRDNDAPITARDLLQPCEGAATEAGLRGNIRVAVQYIEAWISGRGAVPIYNLMEDAATAEISRTQIWQWIRHGIHLDSGETVTAALFRRLLAEELEVVRKEVGEDAYISGRFNEAAQIMDRITTADECVDFLTLAAYDYLP
jgi:malate synthase